MKDTDRLPAGEADRRREDALKRMLSTPPKRQDEMKKPRLKAKAKTQAKTRKA